MAAQPRDSNACANTIVCSLSQPPFTQSVPDTHFEGKAHALLQTATTLIVASVGERRKELVQQIAVRAVELDSVDSDPRGSLGRGHEGLPHAGEVISIERSRRLLSSLVWNRRWRNRLPAVCTIGWNLMAAFQGYFC